MKDGLRLVGTRRIEKIKRFAFFDHRNKVNQIPDIAIFFIITIIFFNGEKKDEEKDHAEGMKEDHDDKAEDENGEEGVEIINEGDWGRAHLVSRVGFTSAMRTS